MQRNYLLSTLAVLCALQLFPANARAEQSRSLAGEWRFRLDAQDTGIGQEWFKLDLPDRIPLPGSTDEHRLGFKNDRIEPGRLTRAWEYVGPAWYQRDIEVPADWEGKRVLVYLERCHWESQLWLDDKRIGLQNSIATPHLHELGQAVKAGKHRLTIRVDNRLKISLGESSGVTEQGPGNWNGIIGRIELRATDPVWIESVRVFPNEAAAKARVEVKIRNLTGKPQSGELLLSASPRGDSPAKSDTKVRADISARPQTILEASIPARVAWDEFSPVVYDLSVNFGSSEAHTSFGMRDWSRKGTQFAVNGRTIVLRGNVDNGAFPQKGYAPTSSAEWKQRLRVYQDYGFNHVRFHSWCPPDAAFAAADELGMIFQVENPMWIGDGRVSADSARTAFIRSEAERIVDTYGNHPSFGLMSMGNELGNGLDPFLKELVESLQKRDPRHFYTSTTAPDGILRPDDYFVSAGPRWQHLRGDPRFERNKPDTSFDYREYLANLDRPTIAHELGQWTVYPDLDEGRKYTGSQQPRYLEIYRQSAAKNQIINQTGAFRKASGAHMVNLYKEEIESILRTPGMAGFQLLALGDWPGFGPAFIGILDTLNDSRELIMPDAYRRFCNRTVPLFRMSKRQWTTAETLTGEISMAHYEAGPIQDAAATWMIRKSGKTVASGTLPPVTVAEGGLRSLGTIAAPLAKLAAPAEYSIEVTVAGLANDWNFWVYPPVVAHPKVLVTSAWDTARSSLREGRPVLLLTRGAGNTVPVSFTTSFWSLLWFPKRPETMGILCDPAHPALAAFPTSTHSDWQWWELMSGGRALILDDAPVAFLPLVQVIDDPTRNHKLGAVFEARVGKGKLLLSTFDLESTLDSRLAARQLRASLEAYAASRKFAPKQELTLDFLDRLLTAR